MKKDTPAVENKSTDTAENTPQWDKVFPQSDKVETHRVSFQNRFGIVLVGNIYLPKDRDNKQFPAIAVSGPFGAVKEQASGLYAQTLA
ncbi:MAG: alpha/beta hydrolase, partial [Alphaproteobacteria bacterium]|nr:alpha/beta hydrolase [Alphaproteobacteria bacterium]